MAYNVTIFRGTLFVVFNQEEGAIDNQGFWASSKLDGPGQITPEFVIVGPLRPGTITYEEMAVLLRKLYPQLLPLEQRTATQKRDYSNKVSEAEFKEIAKTLYKACAGTMHFVIDGQVVIMNRMSALKTKKGERGHLVRFLQPRNSHIISYGARESAIKGILSKYLFSMNDPHRDDDYRRYFGQLIGSIVNTAIVEEFTKLHGSSTFVDQRTLIGKDGKEHKAPIVSVYNIGAQKAGRSLGNEMWI